MLLDCLPRKGTPEHYAPRPKAQQAVARALENPEQKGDGPAPPAFLTRKDVISNVERKIQMENLVFGFVFHGRGWRDSANQKGQKFAFAGECLSAGMYGQSERPEAHSRLGLRAIFSTRMR